MTRRNHLPTILSPTSSQTINAMPQIGTSSSKTFLLSLVQLLSVTARKGYLKLVLVAIVITTCLICTLSELSPLHRHSLNVRVSSGYSLKSEVPLKTNSNNHNHNHNHNNNNNNNSSSSNNSLSVWAVWRPTANRSGKGEKRFPSCIIFGVSKCGTRAVCEYLKLHPSVVSPAAEINFFNNESLQRERGVDWYLQQMPLAKPDQAVVEKSPDYFQHPHSAHLIHRVNNATRLILLLREPVERLVSQYMQLVEKNPQLPPFEKWVIDQSTGEINTKLPSVKVGAYSEHLVTWFSVFPKEQIHIIESSILRVNPLQEMKKVEKFLNIKSYLNASDFYYNSTRGFYCTRLRATGKTKCLGKSKGREHISVDAEVLEKLYKFYQPFNERLNSILHTRFPWS